ncbi:hypothetical protein EsDP_00005093 [Epichloe bromicola]|uniref:Uncharacterized protein n=1 Tax=Epichloe bromicola TaxID=79588 RepID=A0ABQ0CTM6_9HYPO
MICEALTASNGFQISAWNRRGQFNNGGVGVPALAATPYVWAWPSPGHTRYRDWQLKRVICKADSGFTQATKDYGAGFPSARHIQNSVARGISAPSHQSDVKFAGRRYDGEHLEMRVFAPFELTTVEEGVPKEVDAKPNGVMR